MIDHHVDRLGVEAWRHVELTSTNNSIGLIFHAIKKIRENVLCLTKVIEWSGSHGGCETHDPIPNSTVKPLIADDTSA